MQVYGQSTFRMLANPIVSSDATSVLYDAFATFTDDSALYNYTLMNGISYISRSAGFTLNSNDMGIAVEYLETRVNILEPTVDADSAYQCKTVAYSSLITSTGSALLKGEPSGTGATRNLVPHESGENDGMVEFQSCRAGIPESKFGNHYRNAFYVSKLNHYDLEFLSGDSLLDESKMPLKWFECLL
ncbi:hypothetical protein G195_008236 [Phytophthora kernoviae 00238/432]|uniref:Uncharacterized protein n=1 Tax=Phytophthora kernoviae 00238/432 TaxID=1284355 RepID=A0A8J4W347_9STRA|nr:hypothetical protein G195_008236 [Phytophthora kernoviae 00238/432]